MTEISAFLDETEGLDEIEKQERMVRKAKWMAARKGELSSLFLDANPYHNDYAFSSDEAFQFAVRSRYAISNKDNMGGENQRCRCQRREDMCVDVFAEHYVSGCPFYGSRQYIHDQVKYAVYECAKLAEIPVEMEDSNIMRDPNQDNGQQGRERPDLVMKVPYDNAPGGRKCVVEVTIGNTIEGTVSGKLKCTVGQRVQPGRIAARKFVGKSNKYNELARARGLSLKIISIESGGFIHEGSLRSILRLAQVAVKKKQEIGYYEMKRHKLTKISVAL